ncbi:MAG: Coenzyme F420 hydrogenase/dehydrogenase, beta subunit C-terminal domain [Alloprevotella sp.]|nr:Coenzyme F420 hydrogenase/dehydrogenase, beta subunit C-terminal domain [Alloprevotella sp.]
MPLTDLNKNLPQLCDTTSCTGCGACVNSCAHQALCLTASAEGFYHQTIDAQRCVGCKLCERSCPVLNPPVRHNTEKLRAFAAWHKDEDIRRESSSGGAFSAFASFVLSQGGCVVGAAYGKDLHIEHIVVETEEELRRLRLSKYSQSFIGGVLSEVKSRLKAGQTVLFTGTPCQVSGLVRFLGRDYTNLITIDLICHGVPSPKFLQKYRESLEPRFGKIDKIDFRNKRKGWYDNLRVVYTENGKSHAMRGHNDAYWVAFSRDTCLMESCYQCRAQGFPRCSTFTLADFWRIGHRVPFGHKDEIEKGISLIIVNDESKVSLLQELTGRLYLEERTIDEAIGGNLSGVQSHHRPSDRSSFYADLEKMSWQGFRQRYLTPNTRERLVKMFRERLPFWLIKRIRLIKQK